jgi:hypothetical protein
MNWKILIFNILSSGLFARFPPQNAKPFLLLTSSEKGWGKMNQAAEIIKPHSNSPLYYHHSQQSRFDPSDHCKTSRSNSVWTQKNYSYALSLILSHFIEIEKWIHPNKTITTPQKATFSKTHRQKDAPTVRFYGEFLSNTKKIYFTMNLTSAPYTDEKLVPFTWNNSIILI